MQPLFKIRNSSLNPLVKDKMSSNSVISCLDDIENEAFKILPRNALDYYRSGANQMISLRENRTAFQKSDQNQIVSSQFQNLIFTYYQG